MTDKHIDDLVGVEHNGFGSLVSLFGRFVATFGVGAVESAYVLAEKEATRIRAELRAIIKQESYDSWSAGYDQGYAAGKNHY